MPHATALQPSVPGLSPKPGVMPRRPPRRRPPLPSVSASLLPFGSRRWKALRRGCGRGCPGAQEARPAAGGRQSGLLHANGANNHVSILQEQILRSERQPVPVPIGTFPGGSETSSSRGARMAFVFALFVHVTPSILRAMSCVRVRICCGVDCSCVLVDVFA